MRKILSKSLYKYLIGFALLVIILLSMGIKPLVTDIKGDRILIKVEAYDPRDIFRGDYIRMNYEISVIELSKFDEHIQSNYVKNKGDYVYVDLYEETLYVSLVQKGNYYEVEKVSLTKPNEGIYLTANYQYFMGEERDDDGTTIDTEPKIRVDYPLDTYYVAENTGTELEEAIRDGEAFAIIKVYKGYPILKEVVYK